MNNLKVILTLSAYDLDVHLFGGVSVNKRTAKFRQIFAACSTQSFLPAIKR